jgi:biopolymer transport protein ExbB/TolQ
MNIQLNNIFFLVFFVITLISILCGVVWMVITEKRLKRFFLGKKAKDLEETIEFLQKNLERLNESKENIEKSITVINEKLKKSVRGLETLRFNPFPDQGSNQSFAISMLNEEGDGVVLSSLYSRERMSVFAKPIKNHKSEYELTTEEKEVLSRSAVK